jgi:hypothetical protein
MIFKSHLDSLSGIDTNLAVVKLISGHSQFWNCKIGYEFNSIGRSILQVNWHDTLNLSKLRILPGCIDNIEENCLIGRQLLNLVWLNANAVISKDLLIESKVDGQLSCVSETEASLFSCTNNNISEVTGVSSDANVIKLYLSSSDADCSSSDHCSHHTRFSIFFLRLRSFS